MREKSILQDAPKLLSGGSRIHRDLFSKLYDQLAQGVIYCHTRINDNTKKSLEAASFTYALIELLVEKGLITIDALDARKKEVADRLVERFTQSGLGLLYQDPEYDKYAFDQEAEVDCGTCLDTCRAICCKFPFALSRQDVEEGIVRWEFRRPYLIAHDADGYCVHLDRTTYQCSVHSHRPVPCRGFDCRNSDRWKVWNDGDQRQLNSELFDRILRANQMAYTPNAREP
jgi:Fe-S-cluster containining protein